MLDAAMEGSVYYGPSDFALQIIEYFVGGSMLQLLKFVCRSAAALILAVALPALAAPVLTSISPTSGYPGTQVTLNGSAFGASQGSGAVWLGNKLAGSIVSWSDTQIVAVVASGALSGSAQVKQSGVWGNSITFTVITPNITSISPTSGYPGTQVTINGTNFGASQGSGSVWLGNKLAGSIVSWSDTQIVAVVASTALSGSAQVQQNGVWGNSVTFTVITPNVTSISPTTGYPGNQITINGTNFGASQGSGSVWLGNKLAGSIVSWTSTQIVATVAATATSGSASVQQGGVWSNSITFTVVTPNITSVSPTTGVAGTQVTINGTNFGASQGSGSVWLGSKLAGSIVSWSNTQVVATVASGAVTGNAIVQQGGVWSNSIAFTVIVPVLGSVTPTTARAGDEITIYGTDFGATQGTGSVWLGNKLAGSIVSWSDTEIHATVANGAKSGTAQVQQGGVWTDSVSFTVITPHVDSFTPTFGSEGIQVTISGSGFGTTQGSGNVWIGTKYATVVTWSDGFIQATIAADSETGDLQVLQNGVWSDPQAFEIREPTFEMLGLGEVVGTEEGGGSIILEGAAPIGGYTVSLSSSDSRATVPASITIPEGWNYGDFTVTTQQVASPVEVTITATHGAQSEEGTLTLLPPGLKSIAFNDGEEPQFHTGLTVMAHVRLHVPAPAGGAAVSITTETPSLLTVPSTVTVGEGETVANFEVTLGGPVLTDANISLGGSYGGYEESAEATLLAPVITDLTLTPNSSVGGELIAALVTLSEPAAPGTVIEFGSSDDTVVPGGQNLIIPEGESTGEKSIRLGYVLSTSTYDLTASFDHNVSPVTATMTVKPTAVKLSSASVTPTELVGSNTAVATVTLTGAAPEGGVYVDLWGAPNGMKRPAFVFVPEGETEASVDFETPLVAYGQGMGASVSYGGVETAVGMWVTPPPDNFVSEFTIPSPRTAGGNLVTATVTLDAPAGAGGAEILLESSNESVATVPASVTIPEGETTATFDIDTDAVVEVADVTIRATYNDVIQRVLLGVLPTGTTPALVSMTTPFEVIGSIDMVGTVTISEPAPAGGLTITLEGSHPRYCSVPESVTIPEGETSADFSVTTYETYITRYIHVFASYQGQVRKNLVMLTGFPN
jgi:IPT/TIG domain-containing protein